MKPAGTYEGKLEHIFEQGCGGIVGLYDTRGLEPNPKWTEGSTEPQFFHSWEWLISYKDGDHLTIWDGDTVIFDQVIQKDKAAMIADPESFHCVNYLPRSVDWKTWFTWHLKEFKAKLVRS